MDPIEQVRLSYQGMLDDQKAEIERLQHIVAALAVPVGQRLVPARPTDEMVEAAAINADVSAACIRVIYADMLDAAPKTPSADTSDQFGHTEKD